MKWKNNDGLSCLLSLLGLNFPDACVSVGCVLHVGSEK